MPSISQCGQRYEFDVIVLGAGLSALAYCLFILESRPTLKIALLSKSTLQDSNSYYAQGGIAASQAPEDSWQKHYDDTWAAGDYLGEPSVIKKTVTTAPSLIEGLRKWGVHFSSELGQEGGHQVRRILHSGDRTGQVLIEVLLSRLQEKNNLTLLTHHIGINLITQRPAHQPSVSPEVVGLYALEEKTGLIHTFLAKMLVLATGGAGKTYRYTSNSPVATGDGIAMAHRAKARVTDMEFYQFHPTLLYHPKLNNFLISEAVRGEGAILRLPSTGERFMERYSPEKELATRDIVARAIFNEMEREAVNYIHLDITHKPRSFLEKRFPKIFNTLENLGLDMSKEPIPVVPAAHYLCGGVLTDLSGKTDLHRLYVIGEAACTGLHGANRLASNSLLECLLMAQMCSQHSAQCLDKPIQYLQSISDWNSQSVTDLRRASQINAHWRGLRSEMMSYAGIIRTEAGLRDLLQLILTRKQMVEDYYWGHTITRDLIELRNIIHVAELIVHQALKRKESRGGHYREDISERV